jgi:NADH:ubiquinone oxidoreductase subunit
VWGPNGNRVPPGWHGWLSFQYDDVPLPDSNSFFHPFYEKPHSWLTSIDSFTMHMPKQSMASEKILSYEANRKNKYASEWTPTTKRVT